jgi:para-aminobenzoate synthetase/4-amino-4-deoxychorismate lyase
VVDTELNQATFGVGGGVTIDSTAEREYEECLVKSKFLRTSPAAFQLFESILLEDGEYFLLARHVERLRNSAAFFGFSFSEAEFNLALQQIAAAHVAGSFKVRLTLWKDGRIETDVKPIEAREGDVRRVALATEPVDSSDRYLFHKTTRRDFYTEQLNLRPDCDDIIFWNERGEVTESSISNLVVRVDDQLFTPPIESGLLAGTYRAQLLAEGKIKERVITIEELQTANEFLLINSVRKWMACFT